MDYHEIHAPIWFRIKVCILQCLLVIIFQSKVVSPCIGSYISNLCCKIYNDGFFSGKQYSNYIWSQNTKLREQSNIFNHDGWVPFHTISRRFVCLFQFNCHGAYWPMIFITRLHEKTDIYWSVVIFIWLLLFFEPSYSRRPQFFTNLTLWKSFSFVLSFRILKSLCLPRNEPIPLHIMINNCSTGTSQLQIYLKLCLIIKVIS